MFRNQNSDLYRGVAGTRVERVLDDLANESVRKRISSEELGIRRIAVYLAASESSKTPSQFSFL